MTRVGVRDATVFTEGIFYESNRPSQTDRKLMERVKGRALYHPSELVRNAASANEARITQNFGRFYSDPFVIESFPGLSIDFILSLHRALGAPRFIEIVSRFARDPYIYRSGWPDLTLVSGTKLKLREVKTPNDAVRDSQNRLATDILLPLGIDVAVSRLVGGV
jgi:hypothetical protein